MNNKVFNSVINGSLVAGLALAMSLSGCNKDKKDSKGASEGKASTQAGSDNPSAMENARQLTESFNNWKDIAEKAKTWERSTFRDYKPLLEEKNRITSANLVTPILTARYPKMSMKKFSESNLKYYVNGKMNLLEKVPYEVIITEDWGSEWSTILVLANDEKVLGHLVLSSDQSEEYDHKRMGQFISQKVYQRTQIVDLVNDGGEAYGKDTLVEKFTLQEDGTIKAESGQKKSGAEQSYLKFDKVERMFENEFMLTSGKMTFQNTIQELNKMWEGKFVKETDGMFSIHPDFAAGTWDVRYKVVKTEDENTGEMVEHKKIISLNKVQ